LSVLADVFAALKTAIQLEERVKSMAVSVSELARETRDIDRRVVRLETVIEVMLSSRGSGPTPAGPPLLDAKGSNEPKT
jgi:hypothetical protein